jgi:O-antigen ligase
LFLSGLSRLSAPAGGAIAREWARDWAARAAALLLLVPFSVALASPHLPPAAKLTAGIVLFVTLAHPAWGIVVAAALVPAVTMTERQAGATIDIAMLVVCAITPGALLRLGANTDRSVRWPAVLVLGAVIALSYVNAWQAGWADGGPDLVRVTHPAIIWLEGLTLALVAARVARRHRNFGLIAVRASMFAAGLIAAAALVEVFRIAAGSPSPMATALDALLRSRVSPVFTDPNAAGSFLALPAAGLAWLCLTGRRNLPSLALLALLLLGLWLTGSRTAMAGVVIASATAFVLVRRRGASGLVIPGIAGVAASLVLAWLVFAPPRRHPQAPAAYAVSVRLQMAQVALAMAKQHPILGVGLGNFQTASQAFISPEFAASFRPAASGENAHNNFLQLLAELGVIGLAGFVALLFAPLQSGWHALRRPDARREGVALWVGLTAFLITCLAGHPLLTPPILLAFLLNLGLAYGLME